ncbi:hypothetical protein GX888_00425 [Candidatus Dojkabacteria bacterium]|uniref:Uncharacterized protein n=1 Tax=Candidatus Dojkabacteria bacterium TaxID=2099670 RepID=A0A847VCG5_9BACT|nr:hypothetical protein [Candidatus Dojkabacteria bacterium]
MEKTELNHIEKQEDKFLTSFSSQEIENTAKAILQYRVDEDYELTGLVEEIQNNTIQEMRKLLHHTQTPKVATYMHLRDIADISDEFEKRVKDWDRNFIEVLNYSLLSEIIDNINYANKNISVSHLKHNVYEASDYSITADLHFIWLESIYNKLKVEK